MQLQWGAASLINLIKNLVSNLLLVRVRPPLSHFLQPLLPHHHHQEGQLAGLLCSRIGAGRLSVPDPASAFSCPEGWTEDQRSDLHWNHLSKQTEKAIAHIQAKRPLISIKTAELRAVTMGNVCDN